jgi:hypothetical protein
MLGICGIVKPKQSIYILRTKTVFVLSRLGKIIYSLKT